MSAPLEIAVVGDVHGHFDAALDGPLLASFPVRLCTGDLTPNGGRDRFEVAERVAAELGALGTWTILGNHDGPTAFTGRAFPKSYLRLASLLGDFDLGGRVVDLPELDLSLVGARPLSMGGSDWRFPLPDREDWNAARWGEEIARLLATAKQSRIVVLAHCGPTGLGATRESIYGCDFKPEEGDWGDPDLRLALDAWHGRTPPVVALIAGHMHHALRGGGARTWAVREGGTLHVNAAVVPRTGARGRALTVVRIEGLEARAEIRWHGADGTVERVEDGALTLS